MAFKLFIAIVLGTLATTVTAEVPNEVIDCLLECESDDTSCAADCVGIPVEVLEDFESCAYNCTTEQDSDYEAEFDCAELCTNDFNSQSPYSFDELIDLNSSVDNVDANVFQLVKDAVRSKTNAGTRNNGVNSVATFKGSIGLCAAFIAYQFS
ncbi:hypothetical protein IWQ62_000158 [Dispira parvispora]|uniref:Uncharacterized protein n=1 Tax=Dispira parvispora TaxID=1520584 RepID=A0A9W8E9Y4_9FUNG|nr:hypothetical protein IWQ62_000158 [Dispira parvispora]